jgi:hypothetical protein
VRALACTALVSLAASAATALHAAEPMTGRWAADPSLCAGIGASGEALLVVTRQSLRGAGATCRIGRSYRTGNTLHVEVFCVDKARRHGIPVSLHLAGDRITVVWKHAPRAKLQRSR